jgi:flagellar L-ring protein precursor FlgH
MPNRTDPVTSSCPHTASTRGALTPVSAVAGRTARTTTRLSVPLVLVAVVVGLAGCAPSVESIVRVPTSPPEMDPQVAVAQSGSIYQNGTAIAFFETRRARHVGDMLTIRLSDTFTTNNKGDTIASRASDISAKAADQTTGTAQRLARLFNVGSANTSFTGTASANDTDTLSGTLAVSVISTLPGGNLMVAGDKVISTNNVQEHLRFSGVVNPVDIDPFNTVASIKVANARIEEQGVGVIHDSTELGWLQRLFLNVLTF